LPALTSSPPFQEVGFTHMRVLEGVGTLVQLAGMVARLCKMVRAVTVV